MAIYKNVEIQGKFLVICYFQYYVLHQDVTLRIQFAEVIGAGCPAFAKLDPLFL